MSVPDAGPGCEAVADGFLVEPVAAVSSTAFVVAALVVLGLRRDRVGAGFATLVAGTGIGSLVQHGPDPPWADVAHDLPLLATVAFVGADSGADLLGRPRRWWWWAGPTAVLVPAVVAAPRAGDLLQLALAAAAVGLTLVRAGRRPAVRTRLLTAVALLALGGTAGRLSRAGGPWCDPTSLWQGHAVWHLAAATALVVLAPALGPPTADGTRPGPELSADGAASSAADGRRGRPPLGRPGR